MFLKDIQLEGFRVFEKEHISFNPRVNIIYGLNGEGKTSVLEAIYYISLTKSFKAKTDLIAVNNSSEFFNITGSFYKGDAYLNTMRIFFSKKEGKHAFLDNKKVAAFSEIVGRYPSILLSLEDIDLTFGVPASRRKFLDILLSQLYPGYLYALQKYKKTILHKNKLLSVDDYAGKMEELDIWNAQLVEHSAEIITQRLKFIDFLNTHIREVYNRISGSLENISVTYKSSFGPSVAQTESDNIKEHFKTVLEKNKQSELKRQTSIYGPHRDDIDFLKDTYPFKSYGSQGENKSFLIALKFLESKYIASISKCRPLLLLDDIFGELDNNRIDNFLSLIAEQGQTFITTTDNSKIKMNINTQAHFIQIKNHKVVQ